MNKLISGGKTTKEQLLDATNGGYGIILADFGDQVKLSKDGRSIKGLINPFYNDTNPGLTFYLGGNNIWRYIDYGEPQYQGDIFDYCATRFKLDVVKDFPLLLEKMDELFKSKKGILPKLADLPAVEKSKVKLVEVETLDWTEEAIKYWEQYGISKQLLEDNHVSLVKSYTIHYIDGSSEVKNFSNSKELIFAYRISKTCFKFYCPNPKRFWYAGDKPKNFYIGEITDFCNVETPIFITGGFKDALTIRSHGQDAITLSSETATMTKRLLKDLYNAQYKVVVLYDNDETGKKQAIKLAEQCYGTVADLSSILTEEEVDIKDVSDFVKANLDKNRIRLFKFLLQYVEDMEQYILENDFFFAENPELLLIAQEHTNIVVQETEENNEDEDDGLDNNSVDEDDPKSIHIGLDESIYNELPKFFQKVVKPLSESHEKDLVLIGTICVLGNILKVSGIYDNRRMYPNLMAFITAPASAGKGALKFAKLLGDKFEERNKDHYQRELKTYKDNGEKGEEPLRKRFFLSGNSSASAMINALNNSGGKGVIVEYEADVLNNSKANKTWGDFSTVLRNAYEHETITKFRVLDGDIDIECPRLSVAISGTKNQLFDFIPSVENGLFSRFMFYDFPLIPVFKNVFKNKRDLAKYYKSLSQDLIEFYDTHMEVEFEFTKDQAKKFHKHFETNHNEFYVLLGGDSLSLIRRLGSMCFRIAMLLTVSRYIYEGNTPVQVFCSDNDFKTALKMTDTFIKQAENLYLQMPKFNKKYEVLKTNEQKLLESVEDEFSFKQVVDEGKQLDIARGTVERYLRKYIKFNLVDNFKHGHYKKIV
jgi:Protein of unknown function (DUF3987)/Toprim-like